MTGKSSDFEDTGIIPRSLSYVFEKFNEVRHDDVQDYYFYGTELIFQTNYYYTLYFS
jgi:hypothetical protein